MTHSVETFPIDSYVTVPRWYILLAPLFYLVGKKAEAKRLPSGHLFESRLFNHGSQAIRSIQQNVGNASALHLMYRLRSRPVVGMLERFWTSIPIIKGVQNRAVLVRQIIKDVIRYHARSISGVRILGFAAGLSEPLLWGIHDLEPADIPDRVVLTDLSRDSLRDAQVIASQLGVTVLTERLNLLKHEHVRAKIRIENPNILEMIGFIDYFDDENVIEMFRLIQEELEEGSTFIVGNVIPTWEMYFIEKAYHWPTMYYRTPNELEALIRRAKFRDIRMHVEPAGRFAVAVCSV
ncbi:MAG: hypothetical protein RLZZ308_163 [Candidatus Parcubacteria bacterium]